MNTTATSGRRKRTLHPDSRYIVTIVHPQKDVLVGRALDTVKKIKLEVT